PTEKVAKAAELMQKIYPVPEDGLRYDPGSFLSDLTWSGKLGYFDSDTPDVKKAAQASALLFTFRLLEIYHAIQTNVDQVFAWVPASNASGLRLEEFAGNVKGGLEHLWWSEDYNTIDCPYGDSYCPPG